MCSPAIRFLLPLLRFKTSSFRLQILVFIRYSVLIRTNDVTSSRGNWLIFCSIVGSAAPSLSNSGYFSGPLLTNEKTESQHMACRPMWSTFLLKALLDRSITYKQACSCDVYLALLGIIELPFTGFCDISRKGQSLRPLMVRTSLSIHIYIRCLSC